MSHVKIELRIILISELILHTFRVSSHYLRSESFLLEGTKM
jgi:hypothetical protein